MDGRRNLLDIVRRQCSRIAASLLVFGLASVLFSSCGQEEIVHALPPAPMPEAAGLRIAVASDTHFYPEGADRP